MKLNELINKVAFHFDNIEKETVKIAKIIIKMEKAYERLERKLGRKTRKKRGKK